MKFREQLNALMEITNLNGATTDMFVLGGWLGRQTAEIQGFVLTTARAMLVPEKDIKALHREIGRRMMEAS